MKKKKRIKKKKKNKGEEEEANRGKKREEEEEEKKKKEEEGRRRRRGERERRRRVEEKEKKGWVGEVPTHLSRRLVEDSQNSANESNPRSCLVGGVEYAHGQQVDREDPCVYCLCLDGDMFCWWSEIQCHNSSVYSSQTDNSASVTGGSNSSASSSSGEDWWSTWQPHTDPPPPLTNRPTPLANSSVANNSTTSTTEAPTASTTSPTICIVMGREYSLGEVLPQETGTCLECECGRGGRVTCSPKDCEGGDGEGDPPSDDEFHNPNNDANSLDICNRADTYILRLQFWKSRTPKQESKDYQICKIFRITYEKDRDQYSLNRLCIFGSFENFGVKRSGNRRIVCNFPRQTALVSRDRKRCLCLASQQTFAKVVSVVCRKPNLTSTYAVIDDVIPWIIRDLRPQITYTFHGRLFV
ncbi:hypothetical protein LSTR_LSTR009865 [Laodelphax striatellus]|uniref:Uncharacterized protein n=1 Tax=Laodelphax striatellus TaxID=195883 RepID=A0A482WHP9_LAOST|nr:hypothetical protein LSTR_LSTR009865 [Laodelphax striatellus]